MSARVVAMMVRSGALRTYRRNRWVIDEICRTALVLAVVAFVVLIAILGDAR